MSNVINETDSQYDMTVCHVTEQTTQIQ